MVVVILDIIAKECSCNNNIIKYTYVSKSWKTGQNHIKLYGDDLGVATRVMKYFVHKSIYILLTRLTLINLSSLRNMYNTNMQKYKCDLDLFSKIQSRTHTYIYSHSCTS